MTGEQFVGDFVGDSEFERRARAALLESAERLPGSVRSRLTQARHAALTAHTTARSHSLTRRWIPAGALASVVVALFVALVPHGTTTRSRVALANSSANASLEDIDMLSDSDGLSLNGDQDVDFDFYEWAAGEATGGSAPSMGS